MSGYVPPHQRNRGRTPLILLGVLVGALVAAAAGVYLYGQASDRLDRDRLPDMLKERTKLDYKVFPVGGGPSTATPEEQRRYDELTRDIERIRAKHPDLDPRRR